LKSILIALLLAFPAMGSDWTTTEIVLESAYQAALFVDWKQTSEIHRDFVTRPDGSTFQTREQNLFLGSHPKQSTINLFCIASSIGHFVVSNSMDHKSRVGWQSVTLTVELMVVGNNTRVSARIRW
jgi:hypothetical protein